MWRHAGRGLWIWYRKSVTYVELVEAEQDGRQRQGVCSPFNERTGTTVCSHVYETLLHQLVTQIHTRRRQLLPEGALHRMLETKEMMTFDFFFAKRSAFHIHA